MISLSPVRSSIFKKDFRLMIKRGKDPIKFEEVARLLLLKQELPQKYKDHKLQGKFQNCRECHLEPDWLLIYRILEDEIFFERTGTHSDLFKK